MMQIKTKIKMLLTVSVVPALVALGILYARGGQQDMLIISGAAISVAAAVFSLIWISSALKPLEQLPDSIERIAQGNLSVRINVGGDDEFGRLASALSKMQSSFAKRLTEVHAATERIMATLQQLDTVTGQFSGSSMQQIQRANEMSEAVDAMGSSIRDIDEKSVSAVATAEEAIRRTRNGNESVSKLMGEIDEVESAVGVIASSVQEFVSSTQTITSMTRQVKDIADQTNLLALNAAIEAARAGEQGRGFAVVADEVRKLAEKSAQAAREIDEVTKLIGQQSETVGTTIEEGRSHLRTSMESLEEVAMVLSEANSAVVTEKEVISQIAATTHVQSEVSENIARGIENISEAANQNGEGVNQAMQAVEQLQQAAAAMQGALRQFKI